MSTGTCKEAKCGASFVWAKTTKGRAIPVDAQRDPETRKLVPLVVEAGNLEPTGLTAWGRDGERVPVVKILTAAEKAQTSLRSRWQSHFASCPAAKSFSRGRRNPSRPGAPPRYDR